MHPGLASIYSDKVAKLEISLNDSEIRTEAAEILRSLIDRVELHPRQKAECFLFLEPLAAGWRRSQQ
jgi:hypothetical protein